MNVLLGIFKGQTCYTRSSTIRNSPLAGIIMLCPWYQLHASTGPKSQHTTFLSGATKTATLVVLTVNDNVEEDYQKQKSERIPRASYHQE